MALQYMLKQKQDDWSYLCKKAELGGGTGRGRITMHPSNVMNTEQSLSCMVRQNILDLFIEP